MEKCAKNGKRQKWNNDSISVRVKKPQIISHVKRTIPGILVHVLANVRKILRLVNTWKTVNA